MKKIWFFSLVIFMGIIALIYTYPRTVTNFVEPLKNGETQKYIRIMLQKHDKVPIVEIEDVETISAVTEQLKKVRVKYRRNVSLLQYSEDNYLFTLHFDHPDHSITVQKDGTIYHDNKQYIPIDGESLVLVELLEKILKEKGLN